MLFNEIDRLRKGKLSVKEAQTISRLANNILDTVRVEMEAYKHPLSDSFVRLPDSPRLDS
jgi:hypothetical protein